MSDLESTWLGEPGARRSRTEQAAAQAAEHIDLTAAHQSGHAGGTLGPEATHWARSLLDISRFELARADDKANTLFRFYGVVAALSIGLLAGRGWSPTDLDTVAQILFWCGCVTLMASGVFLGMTLYPREVRDDRPGRLLYFGHINSFSSVGDLTNALRAVEQDTESRLVEQLLVVSRLVDAKFRMTRKALVALAVGTALCLAGVIVNAAAIGS
jgi:hypothetical protein